MAKRTGLLAIAYFSSSARQPVKLLCSTLLPRRCIPEVRISNNPHRPQEHDIPKRKKMRKPNLLNCAMQSPFQYPERYLSYFNAGAQCSIRISIVNSVFYHMQFFKPQMPVGRPRFPKPTTIIFGLENTGHGRKIIICLPDCTSAIMEAKLQQCLRLQASSEERPQTVYGGKRVKLHAESGKEDQGI